MRFPPCSLRPWENYAAVSLVPVPWGGGGGGEERKAAGRSCCTPAPVTRPLLLCAAGAVVNAESGEEETVDANSMPNVIRNVSRSARDGTVPHEVDGKQLQVGK